MSEGMSENADDDDDDDDDHVDDDDNDDDDDRMPWGALVTKIASPDGDFLTSVIS